MQYYRLYHVGPRGAIEGAVSRPFDGDAQAIDHAASLLDVYFGVEVWQTDRMIGRVDRDRMAPGCAASAHDRALSPAS